MNDVLYVKVERLPDGRWEATFPAMVKSPTFQSKYVLWALDVCHQLDDDLTESRPSPPRRTDP